MNLSTYEQIELNNEIISNFQEKFLIQNQNVTIEEYEELPISIKLPENINLKVVETDVVIKGQTATSSYKPALLTGGIKTSVPPFISIEDYVVISTIDSSYIEKAKK